MKTDKEMLELAAKAAGLKIDKSPTGGGGFGNDGFSMSGEAMLDWHNNVRWSPLTDDGHALRLAVKLDFCITQWRNTEHPPHVMVGYPLPGGGSNWIEEYKDHGDDPCAATRRAIVCAAAEIGSKL